ncbi:7 transmembrane receptor [Paragonimus heterotremus]|uniref:7 transmembrane receptor n=1 Tax=Paragonimus heterotremus TaxID=100268 RepID=A0A8J4SPF3_9TREM|nr:7 transmembrane receptor [Paragonimus heterotremus]
MIRLGLINDTQNLLTPTAIHNHPSHTSHDLDQPPIIPNLLNRTIFSGENETMCSALTSFDAGPPIRKIIQTHVQPVVIIFTLFTNCLTTVVLTRSAMRNPTNLILLAIAVADLLTVLLPLPIYMAFSTSNLFSRQLTISKGYLVSYLTHILPTTFHTIAIWLTVLLALQRFIYVQYPMKASVSMLCKEKPVCWAITFTCTVAASLQLPIVAVTRFHYGLPYCSVNGRRVQHFPVIFINNASFRLFEPILFKCTPMPAVLFFGLLLFRITVVNLLPSVSLIILTGQLIVALHRFEKNRRKLLQRSANKIVLLKSSLLGEPPTATQNVIPAAEKKIERASRSAEKDSTSRMMLVILIIFLIVEIPTTACLCCYAFATLFTLSFKWLHEIMEICNFLVVLSYPANFFVYFAMSRPFRSTFKGSFPRLWSILVVMKNRCHTSTNTENMAQGV